MPHISLGATLGFILAALSMMARTSVAQVPQRIDLSLVAGPSPYDLSGTGTGLAAGLRVDWQPLRWLVVEPGLGFFSYNSQFDDRTSLLFPELSLQAQARLGAVRPFLGVGGGGAVPVSGGGETVATLHAVGGVRAALGNDWGASGEWRIRAVRPWTGNTADVLIGLSRRLR
jgi:hypothetical protein